MTDHKDPWADLAESLGAEPAQATPQPPARPAPPPAKPAAAARPAPPKPALKADWNDVADSLGLPAARPQPASPPPAVPPAEPVVSRTAEPPRATSGFGAGLLDESAAEERPSRRPKASDTPPRPRATQPVADEPVAEVEGRPAAESSDADDDEPRRRRRRRGGRGRGRRGDRREGGEPRSQSQEKECLPGYGHNLDEERQERRSDRPAPSGLKADVRPHAPWEDEFGRGLDEEAEDLLDDAVTPDRSADRGGRMAEGDADTDGEERPRRRRRRRRGRRSREEAEPGSPGEATARPRDTDEGEAAEASEAARVGEAAAGETADEPTRRRRRRRRRRSGESADDTGEAPAERPRRSADESSGSRQRTSRGSRRRETARSGDADGRRRRRETFSRVGEGRDEDDEGLEFLGMDETSAEAGDRRPAGDEELLAESGLDSVRDVPSWVEAIGIVIAGNMDSRKQPPKG